VGNDGKASGDGEHRLPSFHEGWPWAAMREFCANPVDRYLQGQLASRLFFVFYNFCLWSASIDAMSQARMLAARLVVAPLFMVAASPPNLTHRLCKRARFAFARPRRWGLIAIRPLPALPHFTAIPGDGAFAQLAP
jgi:hypothetical protein